MIEILSLLGSATGGGILGIAGNWLKGRGELKAKKLEYENEREIRSLDMQELKLEATLKTQQIKLENEGKLALADVEADRAKDIALSELQMASYAADKASYGGGFVDAVRGLMRQIITAYLLILMTYYGVSLHDIAGGIGSMDADKAWELYGKIINTIIFLTTTAVTWHYGSRPTIVNTK